MTIAENMSLAEGFAARRSLFGAIDWRRGETRRRCPGADRLRHRPQPRVQSLSHTEKSLVAIARALVVECDFLVLDEPTASLPANEVERLFAAVRRLKERGVGMIYVSHRLDEIFRIADHVVVMRDGMKVGEKPVAETTPEELVTLIVGRANLDMFQKAPLRPGPVRLTVQGMTTPNAGPVDFELRQGELLGLIGLRGAGQEEVGRALFGTLPHKGRVTLDGKTPDLTSERTALAAGIGLMARDRAEESIAPRLSIRENAFLNPAPAGVGCSSPISPGGSRAGAGARRLRGLSAE